MNGCRNPDDLVEIAKVIRLFTIEDIFPCSINFIETKKQCSNGDNNDLLRSADI